MATSIAETHPELFHYTGIGGLEGIVKSQTLWATHAAFSNDATEIRAFEARLPQILRPAVERLLETFLTLYETANQCGVARHWVNKPRS